MSFQMGPSVEFLFKEHIFSEVVDRHWDKPFGDRSETLKMSVESNKAPNNF